MSNFTQSTEPADGSVDPFADPVAYLAGLGIEAELVEIRSLLPEAA